MRRTFAFSLLLFAPLWAQEKKPDFSGRWSTANKTHTEVIEQKGSVLTIATTSEPKSFLKLTIDGRDCINEVNGNEFHSKSLWEGSKLVTTVTGDRGLSMVEVRSLSSDGKTQTVETYMGQRSGPPAMVRIEVR